MAVIGVHMGTCSHSFILPTRAAVRLQGRAELISTRKSTYTLNYMIYQAGFRWRARSDELRTTIGAQAQLSLVKESAEAECARIDECDVRGAAERLGACDAGGSAPNDHHTRLTHRYQSLQKIKGSHDGDQLDMPEA